MGAIVDAPPEARQFDFWLGCWELTWEPDGRATNEVTAILDDRVILERFDGRPSIPLQGISTSLYDPELAAWRQTWIDNQSRHLDFVGGLVGARMVLERQTADGVCQRMVWFDIEPERLRWSWERSDDRGQSWKVLWAVHYQRLEFDAQPAASSSS